MVEKQTTGGEEGCRAIGIIPARYGASRFPGKLLADLEGMTVIERVYRGASTARSLTGVYIATDDLRIARAAEDFGAEVFMTSSSPRSGTERIAEVCRRTEFDPSVEIIVNIQGDEPFIRGTLIDRVVLELNRDREAAAATLKKKIETRREFTNPDIVKVVTDKAGYALYFSRAPIPFPRDEKDEGGYKHIGLYGYRRSFLPLFADLPAGAAEAREKLEQLRILENGYKIKVLETDWETIGIDRPEDLEDARNFIAGKESR